MPAEGRLPLFGLAEAKGALSSGAVHELIVKPATRDVLVAAVATPPGLQSSRAR